MVMPSGRHISCHICGQLFPEGDCRGIVTCSPKCEEERKRREAASDKARDELLRLKADKDYHSWHPEYYI